VSGRGCLSCFSCACEQASVHTRAHAWQAVLPSPTHTHSISCPVLLTCTNRFNLCLDFSSSAGGFKRSISPWSTCDLGGMCMNSSAIKVQMR
jgi:hypothetical protein